MIWIFACQAGLAVTPAELAEALPAAREQLEVCERTGCERADAARAAWLVALGSYVHEGTADGDLAATVAALDPDLHQSLPDVVREADGEPAPWSVWVGGPRGSHIAGNPVSVEFRPITGPRTHPELRDQIRARPDPVEQLTVSDDDAEAPAWALYDGASQAEAAGKLRTAIEGYREVVSSDDAPRSAVDCALISMARIYVDRAQDDHAQMLYDQVQTASLASIAEVEGAVTSLFRGQTKEARRPLGRHPDDPLGQAVTQTFDL